MNALQTFIASVPCGFLKSTDMPKLIELDRLCPVLVRCGGCRFTCAAQDCAHLIKCIEASGDYCRDVSFPTGSVERAATWVPDKAYTDKHGYGFKVGDRVKRRDIADCPAFVVETVPEPPYVPGIRAEGDTEPAVMWCPSSWRLA